MIRIVELKERQHRLSENVITVKYKTKDNYTKLADYGAIATKVKEAVRTPFIVKYQTIKDTKVLKFTSGGSFEAYLNRAETNQGEQKTYSYYLTVRSKGNKFDKENFSRLKKFIKDANSNITKDIKWVKSTTDGHNTTKEKEVSLTSDGNNTYNGKYYLCTKSKNSKLISEEFILDLCSEFSNNRWDCKHTFTTDEYKISTKEKYKVDRYKIVFNNRIFTKTPEIIISCFEEVISTPTGLNVVGVVELKNVPNVEYFLQHKNKMFKKKQTPQTRDSKNYSSEHASFHTIIDNVSKLDKYKYELKDVNTSLPMTPPMENYNRQYKLEKRDERTQRTIDTFNLNIKIDKLERELKEIKIDGVVDNVIVDVDFDLDGFYDNFNQVIILPKYNIDVRLNNYYQIRRNMIYKILEVAKENGLKRTSDSIEDYGKCLYIVFTCDSTWNM